MRPVFVYNGWFRAVLPTMAAGLVLGLLIFGQARAETAVPTSDSSRLWGALVAEAKASIFLLGSWNKFQRSLWRLSLRICTRLLRSITRSSIEWCWIDRSL